MKICIVTETFLPATDGIVTRLTKAVEYMTRMGHEVLVVAPDIPGLPSEYEGATVVGTPAFTMPVYKQRKWAVPTPQVKKLFEAFEPDVVHAVNPATVTLSAIYYAKKMGIPLICSFHTNLPQYLDHYKLSFLEPIVWRLLKYFHNQAPINLVTSDAMYNLLKEHGIHGLRVLPKGVDLDKRHPKFYDEATRLKLTNGNPSKTSLIFVGRLAPEKEISSLRPLLDKRDDLVLTIVGDGPIKAQLEKEFQGTQTHFTGFVHGEELSKIYASADAFVFPSETETLGLVITESMAAGTPVIAASSPPSLEQITDGENGLIYEQKDLQNLQDCIDRLENQAFLKQIQEKGRQYAEGYSWDNASKAMLDAYYETIKIYRRA